MSNYEDYEIYGPEDDDDFDTTTTIYDPEPEPEPPIDLLDPDIDEMKEFDIFTVEDD